VVTPLALRIVLVPEILLPSIVTVPLLLVLTPKFWLPPLALMVLDKILGEEALLYTARFSVGPVAEAVTLVMVGEEESLYTPTVRTEPPEALAVTFRRLGDELLL
jgi:hypothetical protein